MKRLIWSESEMDIDRSAIATAVAKAIAFKQCGADAKASLWAEELVRLLDCAEILDIDRLGASQRRLD